MRARISAVLLVAPVLLAGCDRPPTSAVDAEPRLAADGPLLAAAPGSARITSATASGPGANGSLTVDFTMGGLGAKAPYSVSGGAIADAVWACSFAGVFDGWPAPVTLSQIGTVGSVMPVGTGQVNGRLFIPPPASPTACVANHAKVLVSDSFSSVSVSYPTSGTTSIPGTYARTFFTIPTETFPQITAASITTSTFVIDGALVDFSASIDNQGAARSVVAYQGWITQGTNFKAAGGALVDCGGAAGDLPVGSCSIDGTVRAFSAATGSGSLVPGPAVLDVTLKEGASSRILAGWRFNITLQ